MMTLSFAQIFEHLSVFVYPFARISGMIMAMPVFGTRMVPRVIKLILALTLTFSLYPIIPINVQAEILSLTSFLILAMQLLIGITVGFILKIVFQTFVLGGQIIAMQSGLGFSTLVDPQNGTQVPVFSQLLMMMVTLIFLSLDGHLHLMEMIIESFTIIPIGLSGLGQNSLWEVAKFGGMLFKNGVLLALPIIISLLVVNLMFGVMTRSAPQMNIFSIGFPMTMLLGLIIIFITLPIVSHTFKPLMFEMLLNGKELIIGR